MPKFFPGDVVTLISERTSVAGGTERTFAEGSVGRVCKVHAGGTHCVQFAARCLRVTEQFLESSTGTAPSCSPACRKGC
jgi:hypothetical protein